MVVQRKVFEVFRALIAAYIFTGVILALLALMVYKFELGEAIVNVVIIAIYILATLLGGYIAGKRIKEQKFLWGILLGLCYMVIIFGASAIVNQGLEIVSTNNITTMIMCIGGGMLGGMFS